MAAAAALAAAPTWAISKHSRAARFGFVAGPSPCCLMICPSTGRQCSRKPAKYDYLCAFHEGYRPAAAPRPCPPGHTLHPEPVDFPAETRAAIVAAATTALECITPTSLLATESIDAIPGLFATVVAANPTLTDPIVLKNSHYSHQALQYATDIATRIVQLRDDWRAGRVKQNVAMPKIRGLLRTLG